MPWAAIGAIVILATNWFATGSIVVTVETSAVMPVEIRIEGAQSGQFPLNAGHLVIAGLQPGQYRLSPVFTGTVVGGSQTVTVRPGVVVPWKVRTAHLGGVRFDAGPGMCEAGDVWLWPGPVTPSRSRPESRTCLREVAGIPAGRYNVTVTPPRDRMPRHVLQFTVNPGEWTIHSLPPPPVVVLGRLTYMSEPLAGWQVQFVPTKDTNAAFGAIASGPLVTVLSSDAEGRFAIALPTPGQYTTSVFGPAGVLSPQTETVTLSPGVNHRDIEVAGGGLRARLVIPTGVSPHSAKLRVVAQRPPFEGRAVEGVSLDEPLTIGMLAEGEYLVSASGSYTTPDMHVVPVVASRTQTVTVTNGGFTDIVIDLVAAFRELELVDEDGAPLDGAYLIALPSAGSVRADEKGRVSLASIPAGTPTAIRSRKWDMSCHVVTAAATQRKVVAPATETVVLAWRGPDALALSTHGRRYGPFSGALVSGIPGADCAIPLEAFSVGQSGSQAGRDFTIILPRGSYTLRLADGRVMPFTAPGRVELR